MGLIKISNHRKDGKKFSIPKDSFFRSRKVRRYNRIITGLCILDVDDGNFYSSHVHTIKCKILID